MKPFLLAVMMTLAASAADLGDVKTVYLLPMSGGLDQYLAIRLTTGSILQVVTDAQKADSILTDQIGARLEETLAGLYNEKPDKDKDAVEGFAKPTTQAVTRGRGTIFLVDRKTRNVIWAASERPKSSAAEDISRTANRIADKLARSIKGK